MKAFFSGTDTRELHDNAGFYPYYLSLIVNHVGQYCAKIAIVANENSSPRDIIANKSLKGLKWTLGSKESKEVLVTMNCKIVMEQDEHFLKRLDTLIDARKTYTYKTPAKYDYQVKDTRSAPDWDKDWDKQSSQLPRSSQPSLFDQTFKRPSITSIDLTRGTITSFIAKVLNGCDMEYSSTSLLYTLKQFDAKYPSDRKEFKRAFIFDQIEEQLRNFAVKFYNKEINDEEYAVLMSKCFEVLELTEYRSIDASADLGDIFCLYSWENNKEEVE